MNNETTQNEQFTIELVRKYKTYAPAGRCWCTCIRLLKRLPAKERVKYTLIEGKADGTRHYWLRHSERGIIDPHYTIIDHEATNYEEEREFEPNFIISRINNENTDGFYESYNYDGRTRWEEIFSIDI